MSIRLRLTCLYSAILALTLVTFCSLLYVTQARATYDNIRNDLAHQADQLANAPIGGPNRPAGPGGPPRAITNPLLEGFLPGRWTQIRKSDGTIVSRSPDLSGTTLPLSDAGLKAVQAGESWSEITEVDGEAVMIYSEPLHEPAAAGEFIQVASPMAQSEQALSTLRLILLAGSSLAILVAIVAGWLLAGTALGPIHRIIQTAQAIGAERDFSRRVEHTGPNDEIGQLATTFNAMLTELESGYRQIHAALLTQRRFVADASHELRTPLTTVRGNIELLQHDPPLEEHERLDILADMRDEIDRLTRLVKQLLVLARADAGRPLRREPVALQPVIEEVVRQIRLLAPDRAIAWDSREPPAVAGDRDALQQILFILLDNARVHTSAPAAVRIETARGAGEVAIRVSDTGPGIAPAVLPHVFERFYRGDSARSGRGTGLGLAIAKELAEGQGGTLTVASQIGEGATFTLTLPECRS